MLRYRSARIIAGMMPRMPPTAGTSMLVEEIDAGVYAVREG
jgi:hypothetical protein